MRILRGLSSRVLPCGCLTGVYETYDNEIVGILDARGPSCVDATHHPGQTLPLFLLGITAQAFFAYAIFAGCYGQLQHGNVALDSGRLRWLFSTPELHRWHHSIEPREGNANYGAILSTWDWVFGTFFWPRDRAFTGPLGVAGMPRFPGGYGDQLLAPFRWGTLMRATGRVSGAPSDQTSIATGKRRR